MKKKISKLEREIVSMLAISQYIQFCKNHSEKKRLFLYKNQKYTIKEVEKVLRSLNRIHKDDIEWNTFVITFGRWAIEDKEFTDSLDDCDKCGYRKPVEYKLSKYHPRYNEGIHPKDDWIPIVFMSHCPMCNYIEVYSTGVDKHPEKGLRNDT